VQAIAHHEAGHAVVAWRLHIPFRYVTVVSDEDSFGHVLFQRLPKWCNWESESYQEQKARLYIERRVQVALAGQIAEQLYRGRRPDRRTHRSDDESAIEHALDYAGSGEIATAYLHWLFLCARSNVEREWKQIEAVAASLEARKRLTKAEVFDLIGASYGLALGHVHANVHANPKSSG
jgi:hypothetical protein